MTTSIPALDPLRFPLNGSHLIEASAGTGKTFSIAALYVRLVLGHGGEQAFCRPLTPPEILVVTFTEAATQELRDRIRNRLTEAASYFRVDPDSIKALPLGQDFLHDLRADCARDQWAGHARRLQLAAEWMDEAAVSTIHGWCNRMLREHAFDSLSLFTQNLEADRSELLAECVRDYWRNHFYRLNGDDAAAVLSLWSEPAALEHAISPLLAQLQLLPDADQPEQQLQRWRRDKQAQLAELKRPWPQWTQEVKALLDAAVKAKQVNGRKLQARWYDPWLEKLNSWAASPDQEQLQLDTGWNRLTPDGLAEVWNDGESPEHPAFAALVTLQSALAQLPKADAGLLCHAAHWVGKAFDQAQKQRAQMGFDDLLTGLQQALANQNEQQGERLASLIRRQFPVALIDEFQDTDPVQYDIFRTIYPIETPRDDCSLILIGDPKQAIYAFRGADIYTYLQARRSVGKRLFTLDTNYRSTRDMVLAVNHCFDSCEQKPDQPGAFRFRADADNPLPFMPVKANDLAARFCVDGQPQSALQLTILSQGEALSKGAYLSQMAALAASRIVDWLNLGQQSLAGFTQGDQFQALRPNDIAVLVNNATEAGHIRQALSLRGVRSVYLSDKESVYATPQAMELYRWLLACAEPDNDSLLRAALSTRSLGLSFAELDQLNQDELIWEARVEQFKAYQRQWQRQGVLPMLRNLLFDFDVVERMLQIGVDANGVSGERLLTDVLHLAELLQQASHQLEGEHALIRYLAEQMAAPTHNSDAQKVRLESDADLVRVVTIHKSKGLDYPLVLLPFISAARGLKVTDKPIVWHDQNGRAQIALEADANVLARGDEERMGEDLRKLYVALTRARYVTWLGLAPLNDSAVSAIDYLLGLDTAAADDWLQHLHDFVADQPAIEIIENPQPSTAVYTAVSATTPTLSARQLNRRAREYWWIGSYSQLSGGEGGDIGDDSPKSQNLLEESGHQWLEYQMSVTNSSALHRFPRGAEAGTFLHDLLEWIAQQGFAKVAADPTALRDLIARRCHGRGWDGWVTVINDWLLRILNTPLSLGNQSDCPKLQDLSRYQAEMEFWFEAHQVDLQRLDALITEKTLQRRPRPAIAMQRLNGMLKGFIDLVFEYQGRYYVADYKSNWLGPNQHHYATDHLDDAIRAHRYDLQYVLYLLALHRHLRSRLADYDYDRDVGGAVYLFLRGIEHENAGLHVEKPPKSLIETLDALFAGQRQSAA